jgi:cytochrome c biogenesis protein CcdA
LTRLALIVISIGLADSLNPSTVGPALYLATTGHARRQIAEFATGVFAVNLIGGAVIALGPGQLLLALVPEPSKTTKNIVEVIVGAAILLAAIVLWTQRRRFAARSLPGATRRSGPGLALGAGISLVELPTAFPYFAAIAAIIASDLAVPQQVGLLVLFNLAFILPVLAILFVLVAFGARADRVLGEASNWLQRQWPVLLAALGLVVGTGILGAGAIGLAGS